ncbi:TIGR01777 family oxidoreductase [Actinophytocola gossypii]|uniref:TIGR01777 family oxidoreductase n=1 Tax=Actinophytocola gossypii TaxID=2812003 RepID=A0ABT2J8D3_9PSEU|nr:TIGR01777 family oxidoreductase [Actinophytocola gossypii]MCT2584132.1 TIGR01777 family oxidoreductase [Actinophytocola gossypii]
MRVVVAGSSGLVGTALVSGLRAAGHDVVRLVRRPATAPDERTWDPPAGRIDDDALAGADAAVNLCGAGIGSRRWSHARKQVLLDSRVEPTEVLAAAVAEHGVKVLVNASAVGYYGDGGDRVLDERAPRGRGFLAALCGHWEAATQRAEEAGTRVVRMRTGHVLSGRGGLLGTLRPLVFLLLGGRLGDGRQFMPWIALSDHVAAIRFAIETESLAGAVNSCSPNPVTNREFTRLLGRVMRRPTPWFVPGLALRAAIGDGGGEVLYSQRTVPAALREAGFVFGYPKLEDAFRAALQ